VIQSYCPVLVDLDPKQFEVVNTACSFNKWMSQKKTIRNEYNLYGKSLARRDQR